MYLEEQFSNEQEPLDSINEFLTPREVMDLLYIGKNTFYKLVHSGELPAFRIGKLWRVKRQHLELFAATEAHSLSAIDSVL